MALPFIDVLYRRISQLDLMAWPYVSAKCVNVDIQKERYLKNMSVRVRERDQETDLALDCPLVDLTMPLVPMQLEHRTTNFLS